MEFGLLIVVSGCCVFQLGKESQDAWDRSTAGGKSAKVPMGRGQKSELQKTSCVALNVCFSLQLRNIRIH